jgi:TonB family protein
MMQHAIDRSAQTGGSFATSAVVHVLALVILTVAIGREAAERIDFDELTEIAYIEARYGEDVAEKVKLKKPGLPGPPGRGITTDSAVKKPEPAIAAAPVPEAPTAKPQAAPEPKLKAREPIAQPRLEPKRQQLAAAEAPAVAPAQAARKDLAMADPQLSASVAPAPARQVIAPDALEASLAGKLVDKADAAPRPAAPSKRQDFAPKSAGLRDRGGQAPIGGPQVAAAATTRRPSGAAVAEGSASLSGGGLSSRGGGDRAYEAPKASLAPRGVAQGNAGGGAGAVLDVAGPASASGGGSRASGRKTILDYGEGSGGGGGGLNGRRGRLAEAPASRGIVAEATAAQDESAAAVVEESADLGARNGVGMTISGQIAGRKILHRAPPEYTDRARREGWEGVVAVHFTVLPDGRVKDNVYFEQTSVHRDLNQAAMAAIRKFRFAPLPTDQSAVEQWGVITIVFRLH